MAPPDDLEHGSVFDLEGQPWSGKVDIRDGGYLGRVSG